MRKFVAGLLCAVLVAGCIAPTAQAASATAEEAMAVVKAVATGAELTKTQSTSLATNFGTVTVSEKTTALSAGTMQTRTYAFPQSTNVYMTRVTPSTTVSGQVYSAVVSGTLKAARWRNADTGAWSVTTSLDQIPSDAEVLFLETTGGAAIVYAPTVYASRENEMIEELPEVATKLVVTQLGSNTKVSWQVTGAPASSQVECLAVVSKTTLVNWNDQTQFEGWKSLLLTGDNRWTYDGYYYRTPSTYEPTGENYFHRIPAPYIAVKMLDLSQSYGAKVLSIAMLDVMTNLMNEDGYYPTYAKSTWLSEDYNIQAGYFDTRWNADMTLGLLTAYELYGVEKFKTYADYNGQYWLSNLGKHAKTYTNSASGVTGLLVADYWYEDGGLATHASLNHQLAETLMLFRLGDVTGNTTYTAYARQLLNGVRAVGAKWIKTGGDLWYRIDPDGTMTGTDYPSLTYDDLYKLQAYLVSKGESRDTILTALMTAKKTWMDANGVTGYLQ
jgi:hypothetical protein